MTYSFNIIDEFQKFSPALQEDIVGRLKILQFSKNEHLLEKGNICKGIFIIEKGCCRTYLKNGTKEITTRLGIDKNIITSSYSYLTQTPSEEYIQAIEDTICFFFSYKSMQMLLEKHIEFNVIVRTLYESILINEISMLKSFRTLSALERYELFMEKTPKLLQRVPLGHLSSYLGMSQETLSRMRKMA